MTQAETEAFVAEFAAARAKGRGEHLWDPEGALHYPFADRVIRGDEIGALCDLTSARAPELTWEMLGWTSRGEVIVVEWRCTNRYADRTLVWSGVDRLTVRSGRIIEEIVYADTAPLRAAMTGEAVEPIMRLPARLG